VGGFGEGAVGDVGEGAPTASNGFDQLDGGAVAVAEQFDELRAYFDMVAHQLRNV